MDVCVYELFIYFYWQMSNGAFSFLFFFFVKMKFFCIFINFCYFDIIFKQTFFTHSSFHPSIQPSNHHLPIFHSIQFIFHGYQIESFRCIYFYIFFSCFLVHFIFKLNRSRIITKVLF